MTIWENPPPRATQFRRQLNWLDDLRSKPGEWGRYGWEIDKATVTKLRKRYPEMEFEFRKNRGARDTKGWVWGRYNGVLNKRNDA